MNRNIEEILKSLGGKDIPPDVEKIAEETSRNFSKTLTPSRQHILWENIMKTRITKLAAAAVIVIAALIGINQLGGSIDGASVAWAIEDTAKVLDQFNGIYVSGVVSVPIEKFGGNEDLVIRKGEKMSVEIWAQVNEERTKSGNIRMQTGDGAVGAVYNNTTYKYDPNSRTVYIESGQSINLSPWPSSKFLLKAKEFMEDWQVLYGKDASTGRDYAFVTCSNPSQRQSWWLEVDLETNLPIRAKGWNNMHREGTPSMDFQRIIFFRELPNEMFEFEIPDGAEVVDWREQFKQILGDASYGMSAEGVTKEEACKRIVEEYWQAMINEDWEKARRLRSFPEGQIWEDWKAQYYNNMPAEIIEIQEPYGEQDWITTPMVIKMSDGSIKQGKLMVKFREIDGIASCVVVGNYGPKELNDVE